MHAPNASGVSLPPPGLCCAGVPTLARPPRAQVMRRTFFSGPTKGWPERIEYFIKGWCLNTLDAPEQPSPRFCRKSLQSYGFFGGTGHFPLTSPITATCSTPACCTLWDASVCAQQEKSFMVILKLDTRDDPGFKNIFKSGIFP